MDWNIRVKSPGAEGGAGWKDGGGADAGGDGGSTLLSCVSFGRAEMALNISVKVPGDPAVGGGDAGAGGWGSVFGVEALSVCNNCVNSPAFGAAGGGGVIVNDVFSTTTWVKTLARSAGALGAGPGGVEAAGEVTDVGDDTGAVFWSDSKISVNPPDPVEGIGCVAVEGGATGVQGSVLAEAVDFCGSAGDAGELWGPMRDFNRSSSGEAADLGVIVPKMAVALDGSLAGSVLLE